MVIVLAVSLLIALEKVFHSQLLLTVVAHKVLGMPGFTKSSHNLSDNLLVASSTMALGHCVHSLSADVRV